MNQVETWLSVLSRQAIPRGSFSSVKEIIAMIDTFRASWNEGGTPFTWTNTADEIFARAVHKRPATSESRHSGGSPRFKTTVRAPHALGFALGSPRLALEDDGPAGDRRLDVYLIELLWRHNEWVAVEDY
jgi:hypothetical protein